jgi:hypothetical protein
MQGGGDTSGLDTYSALREAKDAGRMGTYYPLLLALDTLIYLRHSEKVQSCRKCGD